MSARGPLLLVSAGCVAATAVGVVTGHGGPVALAAALVLAAALAVSTALELRPPQRRKRAQPSREEMPTRLRQIVDVLRESEQSAYAVDRALRPLLVPIAAARLGRRGVDMARAPQRAQELLGDRLWAIVRPDRPTATHADRGLGADDLQETIERLEAL